MFLSDIHIFFLSFVGYFLKVALHFTIPTTLFFIGIGAAIIFILKKKNPIIQLKDEIKRLRKYLYTNQSSMAKKGH